MTEIADLSGILMAEPVTAFLSNLAAAIAAIVITLFASRFVKSWIAKLGFRYEQLDDTLFVFLSKFAQVVVLAVGSVFVLNSFGVQTTSIVALLGAAGLAVGLACIALPLLYTPTSFASTTFKLPQIEVSPITS